MNVERSTAAVSAALLIALALAVGLGSIVVWTAPHLRCFLGDDLDSVAIAERAEDLNEQHLRQSTEYEFAQHLAARLAAGTLSLAEATDQMEPILCERSDFASVCRCHYQVPNARLGTARYLIDKVSFLLDADASRWLAVSARLEKEYATMP